MKRRMARLLSVSVAMLAALAIPTFSPPPALAQPFASEPLDYVARRFGLSEPEARQGRLHMHNGFYAVVIETNSRKLNFDGTLVWFNGSAFPRGNDWYLPTADIAGTIAPLLFPRDALKGRGAMRIAIDPGHGGKDSGAIGLRRMNEKRVVLDIARRVRDKLERCGVAAVLTRDGDLDLGLTERCEIARQRGAQAFVSIHLNSASNSRTSGVETYVLTAPGFPSSSGGNGESHTFQGNRYDAANLLLAYHVHRGVLSQTREEDRGIKRARFEVLRNAACPATLVECAFVSNRADESRLIAVQGRDCVAEGIYRGILTYCSRVDSANAPASADL